jgi:DNA-binding MarR family transcriptional regulator
VVLAELTVSGRRLVDSVTELRRREIAAVLGSLSRAQQARALRAVTEFNKAAAALGGHPWLSAAW